MSEEEIVISQMGVHQPPFLSNLELMVAKVYLVEALGFVF
jgi:hypothetical protein